MKPAVKQVIEKNKKKFIIGAIVLICINIIFGIYISLEIRKAESKPENSTNTEKTEQIKSASKDRDIDESYFNEIIGDYRGTAINADYNETWHLTIAKDHGQDDGEYLILSDSETGDLKFEGKIMYLRDEVIIVEINRKRFNSMPANWERDVNNKYAVMGCVKSSNGIALTCRETTILFK